MRSCLACNSKYSRIETELLQGFAISISPKNPVAKGIWHKVKSGYTPREEHDASEKLHRKAKAKKITDARIYIPAEVADQYLTALHTASSTLRADDQGILRESFLALTMRADYVRQFTIKLTKVSITSSSKMYYPTT